MSAGNLILNKSKASLDLRSRVNYRLIKLLVQTYLMIFSQEFIRVSTLQKVNQLSLFEQRCAFVIGVTLSVWSFLFQKLLE